jgi:hypothetical protein
MKFAMQLTPFGAIFCTKNYPRVALSRDAKEYKKGSY